MQINTMEELCFSSAFSYFDVLQRYPELNDKKYTDGMLKEIENMLKKFDRENEFSLIDFLQYATKKLNPQKV